MKRIVINTTSNELQKINIELQQNNNEEKITKEIDQYLKIFKNIEKNKK